MRAKTSVRFGPRIPQPAHSQLTAIPEILYGVALGLPAISIPLFMVDNTVVPFGKDVDRIGTIRSSGRDHKFIQIVTKTLKSIFRGLPC